MPAIGAYGLDLYCDNVDQCKPEYPVDKFGHSWEEFPHQYVDEYGAHCRQQARRAGWIIRGIQAFCPKCAKAGATS